MTAPLPRSNDASIPAPQAIAVAVVRHEGRYLIGQRPAGVPLAGYWEFPGGKVHADETPREAAARECREETGIEVEVGEAYACVAHRYDDARLQLHFFDCRPRAPGQPPRAPFRWALANELPRYRFPEANAALIERLVNGAPHG